MSTLDSVRHPDPFSNSLGPQQGDLTSSSGSYSDEEQGVAASNEAVTTKIFFKEEEQVVKGTFRKFKAKVLVAYKQNSNGLVTKVDGFVVREVGSPNFWDRCKGQSNETLLKVTVKNAKGKLETKTVNVYKSSLNKALKGMAKAADRATVSINREEIFFPNGGPADGITKVKTEHYSVAKLAQIKKPAHVAKRFLAQHVNFRKVAPLVGRYITHYLQVTALQERTQTYFDLVHKLGDTNYASDDNKDTVASISDNFGVDVVEARKHSRGVQNTEDESSKYTGEGFLQPKVMLPALKDRFDFKVVFLKGEKPSGTAGSTSTRTKTKAAKHKKAKKKLQGDSSPTSSPEASSSTTGLKARLKASAKGRKITAALRAQRRALRKAREAREATS